MGSPTYTQSTLETKAVAAAADAEQDLLVPDPPKEKAEAMLKELEEKDEE